MPNWCSNTLIIEGDDKTLARFKAKAVGRDVRYNNIDLLDGNNWGAFDSIRVKALFSCPPELGEHTEVLSFHALYPVPESVRRLPYNDRDARVISQGLETEYKGCGYHWETDNWGSKWGCSNSVLNVDLPSYLEYVMDTPWNPPLPWLKKVAGDWLELTFSLQYEEPGMAFRGSIRYENGKLTEESTGDYYDSFDEDE
tara:strand:- start:477 stop:1070 length:594 start_codon:yes stop_codon:yes gene_type:complete